MNFHRRIEQFRPKEHNEAVLRSEARRADAEALLAELKRVLDEDSASSFKAPAPVPAVSTPSVREHRSLQPPPVIDVGVGVVDSSVDNLARAGALMGSEEIVAQHPFPGDPSIRLPSRKWKLLASGLALSALAAIGASFALKRDDAPDLPKAPPLVVSTPEPTRVQPESAAAVAPASAGGGYVMKDDNALENSQLGGPGPDLTSKTAPAINGLPASAAPAVESQTPHDRGSTAAATMADAPAGASPLRPAEIDATQPPRREPAQEVEAKPEGAPNATGALTPNSTGAPNMSATASRSATPKPHSEPASGTDVSGEPARPATSKSASSSKPAVGKKADRKQGAKRAKSGAAAEASKQRIEPTRPNAPADEPASAAAIAAAPAPAPAADQSAGGLVGAFGYLMHFPAALIQRAANPSGDAK